VNSNITVQIDLPETQIVRELRCSGLLRSEQWEFIADVSGQDETDRLSRNVGNKLPLLAA